MPATLAGHPTAAAPPATIRVLPVPRSEPPTDQELEAAGVDSPPMTAPLLPIDLPSSSSARRRSAATSRPAPVGGAAKRGLATPAPAVTLTHPDAPGCPAGPGVHQGEAPAPLEPSPARLATRRLLATCLEVIGGFRPVVHLRPFCLPEAYVDIAKRLTAGSVASPGGQWRGHAYATWRTPVTGRATGAPPRAGRASQTGPGDRICVRRVQICETREDAAEVAVVLARREKVWAMAVRLERIHDRWLCTYLELL
jgi:hypothetical protein